jgi:hypothetical protein
MRTVRSLCWPFFTLFFLTSCSSQSKPGTAAHPAHSHGPNDGELIELGNEQYHAELLNDPKKEAVTVFILDKGHRNPVPIDEKEVTILMKPGANAVEFRLAAKPQEGDPPGKASRFESDQKELKLALDNQEALRELHVTIEGKPFVAPFHYYEPEEHH